MDDDELQNQGNHSVFCPITDINNYLVVSARGTSTPIRNSRSFEEIRAFNLPDH